MLICADVKIGRVIKGVGGAYIVDSQGQDYTCTIRGTIKQKDRILIGDFVEFDSKLLTILKILPRKNSIIRPAMANIDQLVIIVTSSPPPDLMLVDKQLIICRIHNIKPIIVFNKADLENWDICNNILEQYKAAGVEVLAVSAKTGHNIDRLENKLGDCLSCLSGQSAVGKSSIINALRGTEELLTGELSQKLDRGRHTTRHTEIFRLGKAYIADTPGFSLLEITEIMYNELEGFYPEYNAYRQNCKYNSCTHTAEPDCNIKKAVSDGLISSDRYKRYCELFQEVKNYKRY